ncbi:MAG: hypothetical protein DMD62_09260 [Gemmatimonadetes bacterium]|nr:MAG: hypothetical protein DMD62_09260 [Gemmatimonadota bacterium]
MGRTRLKIWAAGLAVLAACQSEPSGPVSLPLADAASIHLFATNGDDWTSHVPLTTGYTARIAVKLYTASGREITPPLHPLDMSFSFAPATLAAATVADSALLLFDITPHDPPGADGGVTVELTEPLSGTTKSFGQFYVLVHPATASR